MGSTILGVMLKSVVWGNFTGVRHSLRRNRAGGKVYEASRWARALFVDSLAGRK
jgi:hypothetical protein